MANSNDKPSPNEPTRLAILDWGIGGFGFYRLFKTKHPRATVLYFSDSGFTPYGKVEKGKLRSRLLRLWRMLQDQYEMTHLAIACHAASSALFGELGFGDFENATGIVRHGIQQVVDSHSARIGIIGGQGTIQSNIYKTRLQNPSRDVRQRIAQPLSAIIEDGIPDRQKLRTYLQEILLPLRGSIDHLLLACTHYPVLAGEIQKCLPQVEILDPAPVMLSWIEENWAPFSNVASDMFITTGNPRKSLTAAHEGFGGQAIVDLMCRE